MGARLDDARTREEKRFNKAQPTFGIVDGTEQLANRPVDTIHHLGRENGRIINAFENPLDGFDVSLAILRQRLIKRQCRFSALQLFQTGSGGYDGRFKFW